MNKDLKDLGFAGRSKGSTLQLQTKFKVLFGPKGTIFEDLLDLKHLAAFSYNGEIITITSAIAKEGFEIDPNYNDFYTLCFKLDFQTMEYKKVKCIENKVSGSCSN